MRRSDQLLLSGGTGPVLRDEFAQGSLTNGRRCVPGPGTIGKAATGGTWAIASGRADFDGSAVATPGDLAIWAIPRGSELLARSLEPAWEVRVDVTAGATAQLFLGASSGNPSSETTVLASTCAILTDGGSGMAMSDSTAALLITATGTPNLQFGFQAHATNGVYVFGKQDAQVSYTLLAWLPDAGETPIGYGMTSIGSAGWTDRWIVYRARRWNTTELINSASPTLNSDLAGHVAPLIDVGFTFASLTAGQFAEVRARVVDGSNYWRLRATVNGGGTAVDLTIAEVIAGSATVRATKTGAMTGTGTFYAQWRLIASSAILMHWRDAQYGTWGGTSLYTPTYPHALDAGSVVRCTVSGAPTISNLRVWSTGPL